MSTPPTNHETIKNYLLGQMSEQEASEIETRLLTDREFYDELSIVEDELIDQYLGDALSDTDRLSFEAHFVSSPERRQKVRFARALKKHVSESAPQGDESTSSRSLFTYLFRKPAIPIAVAAMLLVIVGGRYVTQKYWPEATGRVLAVELIPGPLTRGEGEVRTFSIASDVGTVQLQLSLPKNEYQTYEAVVRDSSLRPVITAGNLKAQTINNFAAVTLDINANLLPAGDYRVNLSGTTAGGVTESVATFAFIVRAN